MRYDLLDSKHHEHSKDAEEELTKAPTTLAISVSDSESERKTEPLPRLRVTRWWEVKKKSLIISILAITITLVTATFYCIAVPIQSGDPFGCDPAGNVWVANVVPGNRLSIWNLAYVLYPTIPIFTNTLTKTKAVDICWDVIIARGYSVLAGAAVCLIFRVVLVDIMKHHSLPHDSMLAAQYSPLSMSSVYAHGKASYQRFRNTRNRWPATVYMIMLQLIASIVYVLVTPAWLSAMTGYQATMDPLLRIDRSYVLFENLEPCKWAIIDGSRIGFDEIGDNFCVHSSGSFYDAVVQCKSFHA
jgi:uncharacterized RDD family membrane protein YckC